MEAWKRRLEHLARKEARCPACAKYRRLNEGTNLSQVCPDHMERRHRMVFE